MLRFILKQNASRRIYFKSCSAMLSLQRMKSGGVQELAFELNNVYKRYRLQEAPSMTGIISKKEALDLYYQMAKIRRMEFVAGNLYRQKLIRGFCHTYTGQEACCVGQKSVLLPDDCVITSYRCHGWAYIMGVTGEELLGELMGKRTGASRGKGGSMHIYCKNFFGGNGIVGAQTPLGAGIALALQYQKKNGVCLAMYGDGASNQGQGFEAFNIACLMKLPIIFICENNLYGMGTTAQRSSCNTEYFTRGDVIPGLWVDGQNVLAVRNATTFAREYVLNNGPIVMELETYRYHGHSMSDPGTSYRTREEVKKVQEDRDALKILRRICTEGSLVGESEFDDIDGKIKAKVEGYVENAKKAPEPEPKDLTGDIYFKNYEPKLRGVQGYTWIEHNVIRKRTEYKPKPTPKNEINLAAANTKDKKAPPKKPKPSDTTIKAALPTSKGPKGVSDSQITGISTLSICDKDKKSSGMKCFPAETAEGKPENVEPPKSNKTAPSGKITCLKDLSGHMDSKPSK